MPRGNLHDLYGAIRKNWRDTRDGTTNGRPETNWQLSTMWEGKRLHRESRRKGGKSRQTRNVRLSYKKSGVLFQSMGCRLLSLADFNIRSNPAERVRSDLPIRGSLCGREMTIYREQQISKRQAPKETRAVTGEAIEKNGEYERKQNWNLGYQLGGKGGAEWPNAAKRAGVNGLSPRPFCARCPLVLAFLPFLAFQSRSSLLSVTWNVWSELRFPIDRPLFRI